MRLNNTKELLISKAIDLFYEKGYAGASIRDLMKVTKLSNSVLYHHFKNKNELLYVIIKRVGEELIKSLKKIQSEYKDPLEALSKMIETQISIVKERRKEAKIFLEEQYQLNSIYKSKILKQQREIYDIYKKQLELLEKQKKIKEINKTVINFAIHAIMNWTYRWYKEEGPLSIEEVIDEIRNIIFFGILINEA